MARRMTTDDSTKAESRKARFELAAHLSCVGILYSQKHFKTPARNETNGEKTGSYGIDIIRIAKLRLSVSFTILQYFRDAERFFLAGSLYVAGLRTDLERFLLYIIGKCSFGLHLPGEWAVIN